MNCQSCQYRENGMCKKYDKRLSMIDVYGSFVLFYKLDECDIKNNRIMTKDRQGGISHD
ncbi:MAG: hypothetical protein PWP16_1330 [Eubacteriaceae bacterium]|jgi:hypothetical protein|nr:hypothetical protein [Eubacteriaceae bacterium]